MMAILNIIYLLFKYISLSLLSENNLKRGTFRQQYSPVCNHSSSTCVSSGVMQAGHFNRNARRLG